MTPQTKLCGMVPMTQVLLVLIGEGVFVCPTRAASRPRGSESSRTRPLVIDGGEQPRRRNADAGGRNHLLERRRRLRAATAAEIALHVLDERGYGGAVRITRDAFGDVVDLQRLRRERGLARIHRVLQVLRESVHFVADRAECFEELQRVARLV